MLQNTLRESEEEVGGGSAGRRERERGGERRSSSERVGGKKQRHGEMGRRGWTDDREGGSQKERKRWGVEI